MTTFAETGTIQYDTITSSGLFNFVVDGAQGGAGFKAAGGLGAAVSGDLYLAAGAVLEIAVGAEGSAGTESGGGGGGSFVFEIQNPNSPLLSILAVAGGGGGGAGDAGGNGVAAETGGNGGGSRNAGAGGQHLGGGGGGYSGGGGGGVTGGAGAESGQTGSQGGTITKRLTEATFAGGNGYYGFVGTGGAGGFGGGGGGGYSGGGGGGGYGGGGGGSGDSGIDPGGGGGSYLTGGFEFASELAGHKSGNGVVVITQIACFCAGTRILTPAGAVAVEALKVGDTVLTVRAGGAPMACVTWVGQRSLDLIRHPMPDAICPIRIAAGAFAPGVPERDLRLSPNHAVYIDNQLIEIFRLINGTSIIREQTTRHVTYHHIELEAHDIILAEGLPAESYLDTGNRNAFEGEDTLQLHPTFTTQLNAPFCAPMLSPGPVLDAVRTRLMHRAQAPATDLALQA